MRAVKRGFLSATALLLCVLLCGCDLYAVTDNLLSLGLPTTTNTTTTTTLPSVDVPMTLLFDGYAYSMLDERQQENYKAVVKTLYEARGQDTEVDGKYGISVMLEHALTSEKDVEELFRAVFDDHPEFFYLTMQYGWMSIGERYTHIRFYYIWNAAERAAKATELEAAVSSLVTQVQLLPPVEQERIFHDTLIERCEYNEAARTDDGEEADREYYIASSPYAALCTGDPICGGYSRAFQLLLSRVDIRNTTVYNDDHTWTMLWLDGEAYHTDVTWDDPPEGKEGYCYFNITDEEIRATRDYPAQLWRLPEATATTYNVFAMNGWCVDDVYDGSLGEVIRSQIEDGRADVWIKFDPKEYAEAVTYLFEEQAFFDEVYAVSDDTLRDQWYDEVLYLQTEELGIIRIYTVGEAA